MAFLETRFPTDIAFGSSGGPEFNTEVVILGSGKEHRNINWDYAGARWNVAYGINTIAKLNAVRSLFYAARGKGHGFRLRNPDDYEGTAEEIGTGDGSEDEFQLIKTYSYGGYTYEHKITKPVANTVKIYEDDVEILTGWTVNTVTGLVTYSPNPPDSGKVITSDYEYDLPVRFDIDFLPTNLDAYLARSVDVTLLGLKP